MSTHEIQPTDSPKGPANFSNPVIWQDLPDMDIIRVGELYYMSCSSFSFSPGAPILQSYNLVDWEYIGHSVPELAFGERFYLNGQHAGAYVKGIWASTLSYRKSNGLFYWYGPIQGTERTFIYTAKDPRGTWTPMRPIDKFYYDPGLLIDEDDAFYLAYGTKTICVAKLSADGTKEIESKPIYTSDEYLEGARMYNIRGTYYIWLTRPYSGQYVLKSSAGPFGPYECRFVLGQVLSPIPGSGYPHQGGLVDTPHDKWYYIAFIDAYPGGRVPVLAPVTFDDEGWPGVEVNDSESPGQWQLEYPLMTNTKHTDHTKSRSCFRKHCIENDKLEHCWEWNHNPDNSNWSAQDGSLLLTNGTVTDNLYLAPNTLTHRTIGPKSMATFCLDFSGLNNGDRAGACMFRNSHSGYIGFHKQCGVTRLVYVDEITSSPLSVPTGFSNGHPVALDWLMDSKGTIRAETDVAHSRLWLRIKADMTPAHSHGYENETRYSTFEYSYDGAIFTRFGPVFATINEASGFVGYRFAVFNFATQTPGGKLLVDGCDIQPWA